MNRTIIHIALLILAYCLTTACVNDELPSYEKRGTLHFSLCENGAVVTRATPADLGKPLADKFNLKIQNRATGQTIYDGAFKEEMEAGNGAYRITTTYGKNQVLDIDKPYFFGEAEATLDAENPNPRVNIACRVANALLSFKFLNADGEETSEPIDKYFSSYKIRVQVDNAYVFLTDISQSAYFRAGSTPKVSFIGTLRDTNEDYTYTVPQERIPTTIEAAHNVILKLQMGKTETGITFDVHKAEVEIVTINELLPLEWVPAPKIAEMPETQLFFETSTEKPKAVFPITFYSPLQDMELALDLEDPAFSKLNGTYLLSELTEEQRISLTEAGIILPALGDVPESIDGLNFEKLAAKLSTNEGYITSNKLSLRIKANNRWNSESPISTTIFIAHPIFSLPKQAEGNAWSTSTFIDAIKTTDIDGRGMASSEVLGLLIYELSADGGTTWQEMSTMMGYDKPLIKGLQIEQSYQLRARLKNTQLVSNNTSSFTTEAQNSVPNGDFEELTEWRKIEDLKMGGQYSVWPVNYQNTLSVTVSHPNGWETKNNITCNLDGAQNKNTWFCVPSTFNTSCNARIRQDFGAGASGTTHTKADLYADRTAQSGSTAMVLQNVGWSLNGTTPSRSGGAFNTTYYCTNKPSSISDHSVGELFLKDEAGEGNEFATRPTKMKFFYTYANQKTANEMGTVDVEVLNGEEVIGRGSAKLSAQNEYRETAVAISYTVIDKKVNRLRIKFKSSDQTTITTEDVTSWYQCSYGAQLTVDNVTFDYEL